MLDNQHSHFFVGCHRFIPFDVLVFSIEVVLSANSKHFFSEALTSCVSIISFLAVFLILIELTSDICLVACRFLQKNQSAFFLSAYDSSKGSEETDEEQND